MDHTPEFSDQEKRTADAVKQRAMADSICHAYARVFLTDDGKVILEDLRHKFGHNRDRFNVRNNFSATGAATIDGQCQVLREIEQAIERGRRNG